MLKTFIHNTILIDTTLLTVITIDNKSIIFKGWEVNLID